MEQYLYPVGISLTVVLLGFIVYLLARLYIIADDFVVSLAALYKIVKAVAEVTEVPEADPPAPPYIPDLPVPKLVTEEIKPVVVRRTRTRPKKSGKPVQKK